MKRRFLNPDNQAAYDAMSPREKWRANISDLVIGIGGALLIYIVVRAS